MTGKYPPSIGAFYKDIIVGHVAASSVARDPDFKGIFYDGESHFYIDGSAENNASYVYNNTYTIIRFTSSYVVFGIDKTVSGKTDRSNIILL